MPSFGEKLKVEREKRSITLEQISLSTKIGTRMLQALEDDNFNQLPGGIFNKGFVRAYARFVGIDEDQAVADYLEASGETAPPRPGVDPETAAGKLGLTIEPDLGSSENSRELPWGLFAAALLAIALALSLWTHHKRTVPPPQSNAAPNSHGTAPESEPAVANSGKPPTPQGSRSPAAPQTNQSPSKQPAAGKNIRPSPAENVPQHTSSPGNLSEAKSATRQSDEFTVLIDLRQDSWISITSDGKTLASYMANAGTQHVVHGRQLVVVKAGNAGGVDFSFNGRNLGSQGENGQVKTLSFGPQGLQPSPPPSVTP